MSACKSDLNVRFIGYQTANNILVAQIKRKTISWFNCLWLCGGDLRRCLLYKQDTVEIFIIVIFTRFSLTSY